MSSNLSNAFERALRRTESIYSESRTQWDDQKAAQFNDHHWQPVTTDAEAILNIIQEIEEIINRSKSSFAR